jgi:hypothetical protein
MIVSVTVCKRERKLTQWKKSRVALEQQHISSSDESIFFNFCLLFSLSLVLSAITIGRSAHAIEYTLVPMTFLSRYTTTTKTTTTINIHRNIHPRC